MPFVNKRTRIEQIDGGGGYRGYLDNVLLCENEDREAVRILLDKEMDKQRKARYQASKPQKPHTPRQYANPPKNRFSEDNPPDGYISISQLMRLEGKSRQQIHATIVASHSTVARIPEIGTLKDARGRRYVKIEDWEKYKEWQVAREKRSDV